MQRKDHELSLKRSNGRWFQHLSIKLRSTDVAGGCGLGSSSRAQTGNCPASTVIELVTSCSSAQQRPFVWRPRRGDGARLSPTANRRAVVSCSGWPLSNQVMWLRAQVGWPIDGFRLISSITASGGGRTKKGKVQKSVCPGGVQRFYSLWWNFFSRLQRNA